LEKILIAYSPQGKQTAGGIQTALKGKGYKSTLGATRQELAKSQPAFVIAVIAEDSNTDAQLIELMDECGARNINVVPYLTADLGKSLTANFYLDEHVWIDAVGQSPKNATDDLIDCIKNNAAILGAKSEKKSDTTRKAAAKTANAADKSGAAKGNAKAAQPSDREKLFKNLFYICLAVIAVMLFVLISGGAKQTNREAQNQKANQGVANGGNPNVTIQLDQNLRKSESALVGRWVMSDYNDNQFRANKQDSLNVQQMVNQIIGKGQLLFKADKSFQRIGFSENPETGQWEYDPQSKYLKLQPTGVNQYDVVQVQEVSATTLVIVVQENVDSNRILTKMTFTRIGNQ